MLTRFTKRRAHDAAMYDDLEDLEGAMMHTSKEASL